MFPIPALLALAILGAPGAQAGECVGDMQLVLTDPVATAEANDQVVAAINAGAGALGDLGRVVTFVLAQGASTDAWQLSQRTIQAWMSEQGIEGTVRLSGVEDREGWMIFEVETGQLTETRLRPGAHHLFGLVGPDQTLGLNVSITNPRQAVRRSGQRSAARGIRDVHLRAHVAVLEALRPVLEERGIGAFVHLGEGACE